MTPYFVGLAIGAWLLLAGYLAWSWWKTKRAATTVQDVALQKEWVKQAALGKTEHTQELAEIDSRTQKEETAIKHDTAKKQSSLAGSAELRKRLGDLFGRER